MKSLCNKPKSDADLLPVFLASRLQLRTGRKLSPACPWTSEKNPHFACPLMMLKILTIIYPFIEHRSRYRVN